MFIGHNVAIDIKKISTIFIVSQSQLIKKTVVNCSKILFNFNTNEMG